MQPSLPFAKGRWLGEAESERSCGRELQISHRLSANPWASAYPVVGVDASVRPHNAPAFAEICGKFATFFGRQSRRPLRSNGEMRYEFAEGLLLLAAACRPTSQSALLTAPLPRGALVRANLAGFLVTAALLRRHCLCLDRQDDLGGEFAVFRVPLEAA